jgi:secondary thiamine-phosphate synthase enzyme
LRKKIMHTDEFQVPTSGRDCLVDITAEVARVVEGSNITDGLVTVYCPHTTAGITINENADPDVVSDILRQLDEMVPWRQPFYTHCEDNSAAHVKSSMVGCSETIPLAKGRMTLGTWQGIYFCEFDGPRKRRVIVSVTGE